MGNVTELGLLSAIECRARPYSSIEHLRGPAVWSARWRAFGRSKQRREPGSE